MVVVLIYCTCSVVIFCTCADVIACIWLLFKYDIVSVVKVIICDVFNPNKSPLV